MHKAIKDLMVCNVMLMLLLTTVPAMLLDPTSVDRSPCFSSESASASLRSQLRYLQVAVTCS